jgi:hypothetical protein
MRKAHIRKKKRISFLILLTFGMVLLGSININQLIFTSNNSLVEEIEDETDWTDNSLLTSYANSHSDNGANIEVAFHQSYVIIHYLFRAQLILLLIQVLHILKLKIL